MMKNKTILATLISAVGLSLASGANANYFNVYYSNNSDHFNQSMYSPMLKNWQIENSDTYITGKFYDYFRSLTIGIKFGNPTVKYLTFGHATPYNPPATPWLSYDETRTVNTIGNSWTLHPNDIYAVGDFDGDRNPPYHTDEVFLANAAGHYITLDNFRGDNWDIHNRGINDVFIGNGDKVVAGNFDGDPNDIDELLLIKANGSHFILSLNIQTSNWDVIHSDHSGSIKWWKINTAQDHYLVGDYNGDGKDELVAININGWHHTMSFNTNHWDYIQGGNPSTPNFGNWSKSTAGNQYFSADFNNDGKDDILALNPQTGWSRVLSLSAASYPHWQSIKSNHGSGMLSASWTMDPNDKYTIAGWENWYTWLQAFNSNGNVQIMEW